MKLLAQSDSVSTKQKKLMPCNQISDAKKIYWKADLLWHFVYDSTIQDLIYLIFVSQNEQANKFLSQMHYLGVIIMHLLDLVAVEANGSTTLENFDDRPEHQTPILLVLCVS